MSDGFAISKFRRGFVSRSGAAFVILVLCAVAAAQSATAGTLNGTVKNGTTGQVAAGADVILIQLQGGMQPVANTKSDAQGHFSFDNPQLGAGPMLVRVVYKGVNYHEPITPGKMSAEIEVYTGSAHGWCPPDSGVYNEPLAEKAWSRLLALYGKALA